MLERLWRPFVLTLALIASASAADLPTTKSPPPESSAPSCFSSLWDYVKSSVRDCPLRYGPFTLYGTLDGGYGYEQWGTHVGPYADKPNYAIPGSRHDPKFGGEDYAEIICDRIAIFSPSLGDFVA